MFIYRCIHVFRHMYKCVFICECILLLLALGYIVLLPLGISQVLTCGFIKPHTQIYVHMVHTSLLTLIKNVNMHSHTCIFHALLVSSAEVTNFSRGCGQFAQVVYAATCHEFTITTGLPQNLIAVLVSGG